MPQLNPKSNNATYGTSPANNSLTFRERLMERFLSHEYVRVINVDNEPVRWQYMPAHSESETITSDPMKVVTRGDVEVYLLNPGESEVLLGENAYIMIEVLYKQIVTKRTISSSPDMQPGQARNFNFTDAIKQEEYINKIFLGKESPNFGSYSVASDAPTEDTEVESAKPTRAARPKSPERELKSHLERQVA